MGQMLDEPVLVLKSCIGNRSLGWDLLPPGSERYRGGSDRARRAEGHEGLRRLQGQARLVGHGQGQGLDDRAAAVDDKKTGKPIDWYAGKQYDDDMANAKAALADLAKIYPGYKGQGYEIAGFVWWQGAQGPERRPRQPLRAEPRAPHQGAAQRLQRPERQVRARHRLREPRARELRPADRRGPARHRRREEAPRVRRQREGRGLPRPLARGGRSPKNQGYHYNRNAETYMEVGLRLGWAMAELLKAMN